jgi:hypothetical protein
MSNYAIPLCKICYEESLKEDIRLNPDFVEQYKQDNGDDIYCTPDGTVFLCRKIKE